MSGCGLDATKSGYGAYDKVYLVYYIKLIYYYIRKKDKIMYEMKPEYYIGIDMIDEEHKQLFKYADEAYELLHDEFTPDKYDKMDIILEKLRDYTVKHFADEEQYMESIHYKKMFTQKVQHMEFVQKLDEFIEHHSDEEIDQDEQIMGILKYLTDWLINHILYVDCQIPKPQ